MNTRSDMPHTGDMDPEAFRVEAHRVVDWLADYFARPERYPVLSRADRARCGTRCPTTHPSRASRSGASSRTSSRSSSPAHALAPSGVLRVLRHQRQRAGRARRDARRRPERAGDALAHVACRNRARGSGPRMASRADWPAALVRRRHLRHGVDLHAARSRCRARGGGARRPRARAGRWPHPARCASIAPSTRTRPSTRAC